MIEAALHPVDQREPSDRPGDAGREKHAAPSQPGQVDQRCELVRVRQAVGVQGAVGRAHADRHRPLVSIQQTMLGVRPHPRLDAAVNSCLDMPAVRHAARPRRQRRAQHPGRRTCGVSPWRSCKSCAAVRLHGLGSVKWESPSFREGSSQLTPNRGLSLAWARRRHAPLGRTASPRMAVAATSRNSPSPATPCARPWRSTMWSSEWPCMRSHAASARARRALGATRRE